MDFVTMDLIRKKKEELEVLLGNVSGTERNKAANLIQELLDSCSITKQSEFQQDNNVVSCDDEDVKRSNTRLSKGKTEKGEKPQLTPNGGRRSLRLKQKSPRTFTKHSSSKKRKGAKEVKTEEVEHVDTVETEAREHDISDSDETFKIEDKKEEEMPDEKSLIEPPKSEKKSENPDKMKPECDDDWFDLVEFEPNNTHKKKQSGKRKRKSTGPRTSNIFGVPKQVTNMRSLAMFKKCFLCHDEDKEYSSPEDFKVHINSVHVEVNEQGRPVVKCPRCLEKYYLIRPPDKSLLLRNLVDILVHFVRVHPNNMINFAETYECPKCDFNTRERQDWIDHLQAHLTEKVKCEKCGKFVAQTSLSTHIKNMHNDETLREFPCEQCGKFYASSAQVKYHVERVHFKTKHFKCIICDATFYFKFDLERHMFVWHKQQSENHPVDTCTVCGFQTLRGNLMNKHMANHDAGEYTCPHCSKVFQTKNRLRSHVAIHNSNTIWKCSKCDYETKKKNHLDRHVTFTHGGVLFQCDLCSFKGTTERGILSHYSRTHGECGVNLSCFKKIQLSEKTNFTSRKRKLKSATEDNDRPMSMAFVKKLPIGEIPTNKREIVKDIVMKKEVDVEKEVDTFGENKTLNTQLPVEEVTCVMTGDTNDDGSPVILSVQGQEGMSATVADIQFVQNMLQLNPEALNATTTGSESGDGVTVYHIVHSQEISVSDTEK